MEKEFEALEWLDKEIKYNQFQAEHPREAMLTPTIKVRINDTAIYKKQAEILTFIRDTLKQFIEADSGEDVCKALNYLYSFITENEHNIANLNNTGFSVEKQKAYSDYLYQKRDMLNYISDVLHTQKAQSKSLAERCWEICKEKRPDLSLIKNCLTYERYKEVWNDRVKSMGEIDWNDKESLDYLLLLTEAEFNTLKEGLK